MESIVILKPSEVTWKDYRDLRLRALQDEPQAFGSSYKDEKNTPDEEWQRRLKSYIEGDRNWMIFAGNSKKIVGMVGVWQSDEDKEKNEGNVFAMFVSKETRGKGVSKLLMEHLLEGISKKTSIRKLKLGVNTDQTAAVNLYKKMGFKVVKEDNILLGDGKYHNEYVMERVLK